MHARLALAAVLAAVLALPSAAAAERLPYENPRLSDLEAGPRPALAHDARGEGRADDADRALPGVRRRDADHDLEARQHPVRRRLDPAAEHARGVGEDGRPLPACRAPHAARHPAAVRGGRRARSRQPAGGDRLPAQHRPGRLARREAGAPHRRDHGRGDTSDRAAVELLTVRLRRPRRPLGPDVRELQREPEARDPDGDRDRRLPGPRPLRHRQRARHREALRRRRRHRVRQRRRRLHDRPGDHGDQPA